MAVKKKVDPREQVAKLALRLLDASREDHGEHSSFLVRKKVFAYFMNNHHGDGIGSVACKVLPGDNQALVASDAERFYLPAYIAHHGWVALRLDRGVVDWEEVSELLKGSYLLVAPKFSSRQVMAAEPE